MKKSGLPYITKFNILTNVVLCIYFLSSIYIPGQSIVFAETSTGTDPTVTITSPETGAHTIETSVLISGSIKNTSTASSISIYSGEKMIGSTDIIEGDLWSVSVPLTEEVEYTLHAKAADSEGLVLATSLPTKITVDKTAPVIKFVKPLDGGLHNSSSIELETDPGSIVEVCMDCKKETDGTITGTWISVNEDEKTPGKWIFENPQLPQGEHTLFAKATDQAGNTGNPATIKFTLDSIRPIILPQNIIEPKPETSKVKVSTLIKFVISESNALDSEALKNSVKLFKDGSEVPLTFVSYYPGTKEITFRPTEPLTLKSKYYVMISPINVVDSAGNRAFPRFWSFTTESIASSEAGKKIYTVGASQFESPHEVYTNNVNLCSNCHSTHAAENDKLLGKSQTAENNKVELTVDQYCMACHDGTVAPAPENSKSTHSHTAGLSMDGSSTGSSCSSCHNPHAQWSEQNPNLIHGQLTYTHDDTTPKEGKPSGEINSKDQLCEKCHETDSAEKIANPLVKYRIFDYKKNNSAIGIYEDYGLCLRCHNPNYQSINSNTAKSADIAQYYNMLTELTKLDYETKNPGLLYSNREISPTEQAFSGHIIKAQDGSPLAGYMPCAECHDTHGSDNIKQLKTNLGHENPKAFDVKTGEWTPAVERDFCLKCHNGDTAIYGVTGKKPDAAIEGHSDTNTTACSTCHGTGENAIEKARSAAHAPRLLSPTLKELGVIDKTLSPAFSPNVKDYSLDVAQDVTSIEIIGTPKNEKNTVSGTGIKTLQAGENKFTITVKTADGRETQYTVTVNRPLP